MQALLLPDRPHPECEPLTCTRPLGDCPVANLPLRAQVRGELESAGFDLTTAPPAGLALYLLDSAWLPATDLAPLDRLARPTRVLAPGGALLGWVGESAAPPAADAPAVTAAQAVAVVYAWDLLRVNEALVNRQERSLIRGHLSDRATVDGALELGVGSVVLPGVYVEGSVIVGRDCKVGPNCYLRGPTAIGDGCHVGQAVELKASILYERVGAGHLSYVGDSIIGARSNLGAGTITANLRHDGKNHRSQVGDALVDTGRRKFGVILGDDVHTGIHTSFYPGRKLWPGTSTRPGAVVEKDGRGG